MDEFSTNRLIKYANFKGISISAFEKSIGKAPSYLRNSKEVTSGVLREVMNVYPELSIEWIITGEGEMLKSSGSIIGSNQGEGNKIEYKNAGNVEFGNNINVTLPESGTQKIINPDGSIEIQQESSKIDISNEIQRLKLALHEKEI